MRRRRINNVIFRPEGQIIHDFAWNVYDHVHPLGTRCLLYHLLLRECYKNKFSFVLHSNFFYESSFLFVWWWLGLTNSRKKISFENTRFLEKSWEFAQYAKKQYIVDLLKRLKIQLCWLAGWHFWTKFDVFHSFLLGKLWNVKTYCLT